MTSQDHLDQLTDEILSALQRCEIFVSDKLRGGTAPTFYELGRLQSLLQEYDTFSQDTPEKNERLTEWTKQVERLRHDCVSISLHENPGEGRRIALASEMHKLYSEKSHAGSRLSSRYVLLASGVALATALNAIAQSWVNDQLVMAVSSTMQIRFLPALLCAWAAVLLYNLIDGRYAHFWETLTEIWSQEADAKRKTTLRTISTLDMGAAILMAVSVGLQIAGAYDLSTDFLAAKKNTRIESSTTKEAPRK